MKLFAHLITTPLRLAVMELRIHAFLTVIAVCGQFHAQAFLPPGMGPSAHSLRGWVGLWADPDAVTKGNVSSTAGNRT